MYNICRIMQEKGITDPDSEDGIQCCLDCPEPECLLGMDQSRGRRVSSGKKALMAIRLHKSGLSVAEIAKIMHKSIRQIQRYLEKENA